MVGVSTGLGVLHSPALCGSVPLPLASASEGGGSSYGNVHQIAGLKSRMALPEAGKQHLGEEAPLER